MKVKFGSQEPDTPSNTIHMPPSDTTFNVEMDSLENLISNLQLYVSALPGAIEMRDHTRCCWLLRAIAIANADIGYVLATKGPGDEDEEDGDDFVQTASAANQTDKPADQRIVRPTARIFSTTSAGIRAGEERVTRPASGVLSGTDGQHASARPASDPALVSQPEVDLSAARWDGAVVAAQPEQEGEATRDYVGQ